MNETFNERYMKLMVVSSALKSYVSSKIHVCLEKPTEKCSSQLELF